MHLPNHDPAIYAEQRDFWDSLQMDYQNVNQNLSAEDYQFFMERSFVFSLCFRGCTSPEIAIYQKLLQLKDYGYIILLELAGSNRPQAISYSSEEFALCRFIKKTLPKSFATGPVINNKLSILVSEDSLLSDSEHKEDSLAVCDVLCRGIGDHFKLKATASIGNITKLQSIYSSFTDALCGLYYNGNSPVIYYPDIKNTYVDSHFDYHDTQRHLVEAVRLRKIEAYDYFALLMENIRHYGDTAKRNKILELLVLANNAMSLDLQNTGRSVDYISYTSQLMNQNGDDLIDYGYQMFIYITSYIKPQNPINYSNRIVQATKEYLASHYAEDISLEVMAEYVNISPQYFSKLIKKTTGFNFIDWLAMFRVKKAKELLNNSNLTVKEVCFMVGYKDPNYFSRIFKKRIGITPSEYVKANSLNNKS